MRHHVITYVICEPVTRILCEDWRLDRAIAEDANDNRLCNERVA